jgi:hypothetical protein
MDMEQLQWIIDHEYQEWEQEMAREELEKRRNSS